MIIPVLIVVVDHICEHYSRGPAFLLGQLSLLASPPSEDKTVCDTLEHYSETSPRGADILIYSQDTTKQKTIQVRTISKKETLHVSIPLSDYLVICLGLDSKDSEACIMGKEDVIHKFIQEKDVDQGYYLHRFRRHERVLKAKNSRAT
jgi:hypothetical protein